MKNKKLIGLIIFIVLIIVIILIKNYQNIEEKTVDLSNLDTVYIATGGGKEDFIKDEKVVDIMQNKYNFSL